MRVACFVFSAFLAVAAASRSSQAAESGEPIKNQENAARAACLMGNYQKGAEILVRLFIQTREPVYLYNQGRCYQQNHRWAEALDRFQEYLRKAPELDLRAKEDTHKHIAECEAHLPPRAVVPQLPPEPESEQSQPAGKERPSTEHAPAPDSIPAPALLPSPASGPEAASKNRVDLTKTAPAPSEPQAESSIFSRWWFWTAVGVVVAGGVTAGLLLTRSSSSTIKPFSCPDCESTPSGVNAP
jgi:tetratricopeptide (TPR) repeat protein